MFSTVSPQTGVLGGAFFYVTALMMTVILVPLRMLEIGYSPMEIGIIAAVPGLVLAVGQLMGGGLYDRFGGRRVLLASYVAMIVSCLLLVISTSLAYLVLSQAMKGLSSCLFWPSSQSYASHIDPARSSEMMGRHTSTWSAANIAGFLGGGYMLSFTDFTGAFTGSVIVAVIGLLFGFVTPELKGVKAAQKNVKEIMGNLLRLLVSRRPLILAIICSFGSGVPSILMGSFYPVLFTNLGYDETAIAIFSALVTGALFLTGLVFARIHARLGSFWTFFCGSVGLGVSLIMVLVSGDFGAIAFIMLATGFTQGLLTVFRLLVVMKYSSDDERGSAMSVADLGYVPALLVPVVFGMFFHMSFLVLGGLFVILGIATRFLFIGLKVDIGVTSRKA